MLSVLTALDELLPYTIRIKVDYFNAVERARFENYSESKQIATLVENGVDVSLTDFLTYALFGSQHSNTIGLQSFEDFQKSLKISLGELRTSLLVEDGNLYSRFHGNDQQPGVAEKIGIGITLAVASAIHGMNEADWERIPVAPPAKTLDFGIDQNNTRYVFVEAKGSSVDKISRYAASDFIDRAESIAAKKTQLRNWPSPWLSTSYGMIGVIGTEKRKCLQCWLVDPENDTPSRNPTTQKLINRLSFIRRLIWETMPNAHLLELIDTRIQELSKIDRMDQTVGLPLELDETRNWQRFGVRHIIDLDMNVVGRIVKLEHENTHSYFFWGLHRKVIDIVVEQNTQSLLRYPFIEPSIIDVKLVGDEVSSEMPPLPEADATEGNQSPSKAMPRRRFGSARLHITSSGRVFGVVNSTTQRMQNDEVDDR